jgi:Branched-chain amino acid transport system / permease component
MGFADYIQFVLAPQIINGLALGTAVVLVALGLTIIFGLLDVINMSHGEFYAIGAFGAFGLSAAGLNFWISLALIPILMVPFAVAVERLLIRRVFDGDGRHVSTLLLTFGLSLVLEDLLKVAFGPNTHSVAAPVTGAIDVFGVAVPTYRLLLIGLGATHCLRDRAAHLSHTFRRGGKSRRLRSIYERIARRPGRTRLRRDVRIGCRSRGNCRRLAGAALLRVPDHGQGFYIAGLLSRDRGRNGLDLGSRDRRAGAHSNTGACEPGDLARVGRSYRVRRDGSGPDVSTARTFRKARSCVISNLGS